MKADISVADFAREIGGIELQPWHKALLDLINAGGTLRLPTEIDQRQANRAARAEWLRKWHTKDEV